MYEVLQSARASDTTARRNELESGAGFKISEWVRLKALNKLGVVHDVLRCRSLEGECYRLQVAVVSVGLFNVPAGPEAVEKLPLP